MRLADVVCFWFRMFREFTVKSVVNIRRCLIIGGVNKQFADL